MTTHQFEVTSQRADTAVLLLCGGRGERLRPLTESVPKPLVSVKGKPILTYILEHATAQGFGRFVVAAGYMGERIREYVTTLDEQHPPQVVDSGDVDIIQRIKDCAPYLGDRFVLLYGDTLANVDMGRLLDFHVAHGGMATVTLWPLRSQFGLADLDGESNVTRFREKPVLDQWINIGYFCFERAALEEMQAFDSFAEFLEALAAKRALKGFRHDGFHITINTIRELEEAEYNIGLLGIR